MKKKIVFILSIFVLLSTSLSAQETQMPVKHKQEKMKMSFINMVMNLKLGEHQRMKIKTIIKDSMDTLPNLDDAFSENRFDKQKYIQLAKERRIMKIELRAQMIEKVYALLSHEQKVDLRTMMDVKEMIKERQKLHEKH